MFLLQNRDSHREDLKCGLDNAREGVSKRKLPPVFDEIIEA